MISKGMTKSKGARLKWTAKSIGPAAIVYERDLNPRILKAMPLDHYPRLGSSLTAMARFRLMKRISKLLGR